MEGTASLGAANGGAIEVIRLINVYTACHRRRMRKKWGGGRAGLTDGGCAEKISIHKSVSGLELVCVPCGLTTVSATR